MFLPYLKLSSFKSKLRVLSLVPFLRLIFKLINSNQPNQLNLENERKTNLRWYRKLLFSNQVVFKIKLRFIIIYLTLIYIGSMVGFIAFWSYISLTDVFGYLIKPSDTVDNAYSLIYQSLSSNEHILLFDTMKNFVLALLVAIFIIFLIGIVVDNETFLFANAIRKTKVRLVIILVIIELVQVLFIFFTWKYFSSFGYPSDQFDINDQVSTTWAKPTYSGGFYISTIPSAILWANLLFASFYLNWLLLYLKSGIYSRWTKILILIPFAWIFFIKKQVFSRTENKQEQLEQRSGN